jgi:hypothetical protein
MVDDSAGLYGTDKQLLGIICAFHGLLF